MRQVRGLNHTRWERKYRYCVHFENSDRQQRPRATRSQLNADWFNIRKRLALGLVAVSDQSAVSPHGHPAKR